MGFSSRGITGPESRRWGWRPLRTGQRDAILVGAALLLLVPILLASTGMFPLPALVERGIGRLVPGAAAEVPAAGRPSPVGVPTDPSASQPVRSPAAEPNAGSVLPIDPEARRRAAPAASAGADERLGPAAPAGSGSRPGSGSQDEGHGSTTPDAGSAGVGKAGPNPTVTVSASESGVFLDARTGGVDVAASGSPTRAAEVSGGLTLADGDSPAVEAKASVDASASQAKVSTSVSVADQPAGIAVDVGQGVASTTAALPVGATKVTPLGGNTGVP